MPLTWGYDLVSPVQPGDRVLHWQTRAPRGLVGWSEVELISLIGELSMPSGEFRCRWAAHDVRFHRTGRKRLVHPVAGTLDLEVMEFPTPAMYEGQEASPQVRARGYVSEGGLEPPCPFRGTSTSS